MTTRRTKIAIVGLGHAANSFHLPCLSKFDDVELILCEAWQDRLIENMKRMNIPEINTYLDIDVMLAQGNPDAVYVLLPQYSTKGNLERAKANTPYVEYVTKVLDAKKPVFVEKPLGVSVEQAGQLLEVAKRNGVKTTMCGYQRRFNPLLQYSLLVSG